MSTSFTHDIESKRIRSIVYKLSLTTWFIGSVLIFFNAAFAETVKVGVLVHLTEDMAPFGQMQKNSSILALDEMRDQLEEKIKVELFFQDTPTLPEKIRLTVRDLIIEEKVSVIIASISSAAAWEAAPFFLKIVDLC